MTAGVSIETVLDDPRWQDLLPEAAQHAEAAARQALQEAMPALGFGTVSVILACDVVVRDLNQRWRSEDRATNVLSFPADDPRPAAAASALQDDRPRHWGDVILALETVAAEAQAQGKTLADHLAHLVVHGVLHLLGYDHIEDVQGDIMENLEAVILSRLGVADPYRPHGLASGVSAEGM